MIVLENYQINFKHLNINYFLMLLIIKKNLKINIKVELFIYGTIIGFILILP